MVKNKIINLGDPTDDTDAVNKQYLEKSHVKTSHYNNEFKYLMTNRLAWTDLPADSFSGAHAREARAQRSTIGKKIW